MAVHFFEVEYLLRKMNGILPLVRLLVHDGNKIFGQNCRKTGHVVDKLFPIQRGERAAEFVHRFHELRVEAAHTGIEEPE